MEQAHDIPDTKLQDTNKDVKVAKQESNINPTVKKAEIIVRNSRKPRYNFCNISKYLHIIVFEYLSAKEIFKICRLSRSFHKSSQDDGIWEKYFPNQLRMSKLIELEKVSKNPKSKKQLLMKEFNVVQNLSQRKRYQNYNLVGHDKMITALDIQDGLIVSGSKDNLVKIWDIQKKKSYNFDGHMNLVSQAFIWDERSAITASADKSIRYWDIQNVEDCKTLKGHGFAVTQVKRLNNSFNRIVSSSLDCSVKIWEVYSGKCLQTYSDHGSGVQKIAMNTHYLASYSDQDNLLIVRDFEKGQQLLRISNFQELLGYSSVTRSQYAVGFEIGDIIMDQENPFVLITSESKRIRLWDLRQSLEHRSASTIENPTAEQLPSKAYALNEKFLQNSSGVITKSFKMRYQPSKHRLTAHFFGARGLFTYDLRKGRQLDYYDFHYYPMTDFSLCTEQLSNFAVSSGTTYHMQYDIRPVDLTQSSKDHDKEYKIVPGHKAVITQIRSDGEYIVTGAKNGELKVMNFNVYKGELNKAPSCITIKC